MTRIDTPRYPETLQFIFDNLEQLFIKEQIPNPVQLAHATVICLKDTIGGFQVYIPTGKHAFLHIRNAAIKKAHEQGAHVDVLSKQYNLSVPHIYDIISVRKPSTPKQSAKAPSTQPKHQPLSTLRPTTCPLLP